MNAGQGGGRSLAGLLEQGIVPQVPVVEPMPDRDRTRTMNEIE